VMLGVLLSDISLVQKGSSENSKANRIETNEKVPRNLDKSVRWVEEK
jgi:hypothetical protein